MKTPKYVIPYTLLCNKEASLLDVATYIALIKNMNYKSKIVHISREDLSKLVPAKIDTIRDSMNYLAKSGFIEFTKDSRQYITKITFDATSQSYVAYNYVLYNLISGAAASIYTKLLMIAGKEKIIYAGITSVAEKLNVNYRRLRSCLEELSSKGLLSLDKDGNIVIQVVTTNDEQKQDRTE